MVKLLDPFSGYLLAYGNFLIHIGYFVAILYLPKGDEKCDEADYDLSWKLLLSSHILVFVFHVVSQFMTSAGHVAVPHALDWLSLFFYQGSIFYTQAQYFKSEKECQKTSTNL